MDEALGWLSGLLKEPKVVLGLQVAALVLVGLALTWGVAGLVARFFRARSGPAQGQTVRRLVIYAGVALIGVSVLRQLGVDLSVLLGAAGLLTVAVGFASQTSASNIISGLFLLGEQPFVVGDIIAVGTTTGELVSIDLLSVKIRTFDNLVVRLPNELLLKQPITNLTRNPIRRMDVVFGISYHEDFDRVSQLLRRVAERNPYCLEEPAPVLLPQAFGETGLTVQFSVWITRERFLEVRKTFMVDVLKVLREEGIEMSYPHRRLSASETTEPFPIRIVSGEERLPHAPPRVLGFGEEGQR